MADNRDNSHDSRIFGFAERKLFVGEATGVIASFKHVPYDSGYAIVSDREAHYRSMSHHADYLSHSGEARDPVDRQDATEEDHDRRTAEVTARIAASGEAFFSCSKWRGMRCMRVSVSG